MVENRVNQRRLELGMTLEELSEKCGVPVSTISEVERGREPGVCTAQDIAWALGKPIDYLWPRYR